MTLGGKLKEILREQMDAETAKRRAEEEAKAIMRAKHRAERTELIKAIITSIDMSINAGRVPNYKVYGTEQQAWIGCCAFAYNADDQDLWDNLVAWLRNEGLEIKISDGWAGDGSYDWKEVSVKLLPGQEIEAD